MTDTIFIKGLVIHARHGVMDHETEVGQRFVIDIELFADRLSRGANWDALKLFLQEWASEQSVAEVYAAAQHRRIPFAPVSTMGDLLASPHLKARGFFATLDVAGARVTVPGAPYKLSATPWAIRRPAPRLGEHTADVFREVGLDA